MSCAPGDAPFVRSLLPLLEEGVVETHQKWRGGLTIFWITLHDSAHLAAALHAGAAGWTHYLMHTVHTAVDFTT